jgi:hypothetical protein
MEFLTVEKKEIVGFDIDLVKEMAVAAGFDYEIKNTAWDGIFAGLEKDSTTRSYRPSPSRTNGRRLWTSPIPTSNATRR